MFCTFESNKTSELILKKKMRYEEILKEIESVNLKEKFIADFESNCTETFLGKIKKTDKINSTASLLRILIKFYEYRSEDWEFWKNVLNYFMMPDFVKDKIKLANEKIHKKTYKARKSYSKIAI